jgi:hypothetical protein
MVPDECVALCAAIFMLAGGSGFGWVMAPESAEYKLAKIHAGLHIKAARRTLPPDSKIVECVMVWVGGPGGEPELWCPAVPPEEQAPPAVPTS